MIYSAKKEEKIEVARKMLMKGMDLETILELVDLKLEELEELQQEVKK